MKQHLTAFARDIDAFCAKLNDGLTAVAVLLGVVVVTLSVIRAAELMPDPTAPTPAFYQVTMGQ